MRKTSAGYADVGTIIINSAREKQNEVSKHKHENELLQAQLERWSEHRKAGIPKRETAAADAARDAAFHAGVCEREAREAKHKAFAEKKQLEESTREWTERRRVAEEMARRAEEQLAVAQRSFDDWRHSADAAAAEGMRRRTAALDAAKQRLAKIKADAEARNRAAEVDLEEERHRGDAEVSQEREKLERKLLLDEAHGEERRTRGNAQVHAAEFAARAAETKADQHESAAKYRADRSGDAASAKQRLANAALEEAEEKSSMTLRRTQEEHEGRVQAAMEKVDHSMKALQKRVQAAEASVIDAQKQRDLAYEECEGIEHAYKKQVEKVRWELSAKAAYWEKALIQAEADSALRVADVRGVAQRLKAELVDEVQNLEEQLELEAALASARALEHEDVLDRQVSIKQRQTATALKQADDRVSGAQSQFEQQTVEAETSRSHALEQAAADLQRVESVLSFRLKDTVGHLMTYLERPNTADMCLEGSGSALEGSSARMVTATPFGASLELSIGLPGSPEPPDSMAQVALSL